MTWRDAFLSQAASDYEVLLKLSGAGVAYCHRLHYLQMVTEKLAKAMLTSPRSTAPPVVTHAAFVRMLQVLKTRPEIRLRLGFPDAIVFKRYIDSLLDLATRIEKLAPSQAGLNQPNPEYPWNDTATNSVLAPTEYAFPEYNPKDPKMIKIDELIRGLLRIFV